MNWNNILPYSPAILKLLTGATYSSNKEWDMLLSHRTEIEQYFEQIGISLEMFEEEGFAYLSQPRVSELDEETQLFLKQKKKIEKFPVIIYRKQLSDEQTLLSVLLREKYDELEDNIISRQGIFNLLRDFYKENLNKEKEEKHYQQLIESMINLNFLTSLKIQGSEESYRIEKILKAKVDITKIVEIKEKLIKYYGEQQTES
ncbi:MAG: DUF4194 domain-containing protein [Bacteroidia bacterium]|nr:DUF4194 domain-containing protein [Bacteroidia bacterium]